MTTPTPLRLDYFGQVLTLSDEVLDPDAPAFYRRLLPEEAEDGTIHIVPSVEPMLAPAKPRTNLGLRECIIAEVLLQDREIEHRRHTRSYPELPNPVEVQPVAQCPVNTHVVHFVQENDRGVILLGKGVGRCAIIAELVKAFPRQRFAVMTANHRQSKEVQYKLGKFDIRCQRFTNAPGRNLSGRIVVGTFDSLNDRSVEFEKREVLIAYDAKQALAERAQQLLVQPDVCGRLFGFRGAGTDVSPLQDDQLTATFGFDQISVPLHGYCSVRVDVHFITYNGGGGREQQGTPGQTRRNLEEETPHPTCYFGCTVAD